MVPLTLAAAFGAAKLNEWRFFDLRQRWKEQRTFDAVRCSCELGWYLEDVKSHHASLVGRFSALREQKDKHLEKCLILQGEIPFAAFPTQIIAMVKKSWAMRACFQELNRKIDTTCNCTQPLLLTQSAPISNRRRPSAQPFYPSDSTFLAQHMTRWWLNHASEFRSRAFENCIDHFERSQLDDLNSQLRILYYKAVEQVWVQMIERSEKIVTAMAWFQIGFFGSIPLSFGSIVVAHCSKQLNAQMVAKVFFTSSRFFGIGSLAFAIAMGLAVRSYGQLLGKGKEHVKAIDEIKELMRHTIHPVRKRRYQELVKLGFRKLEEFDEKLAQMGLEISKIRQSMQRKDQRIMDRDQILKKQSSALSYLTKANREKNQQIGEQSSELIDQEAMLKEQDAMLTNQEAMLKDQDAVLLNHKARLVDQESKLTSQDVVIQTLIERLSGLESSRLAQAG